MLSIKQSFWANVIGTGLFLVLFTLFLKAGGAYAPFNAQTALTILGALALLAVFAVVLTVSFMAVIGTLPFLGCTACVAAAIFMKMGNSVTAVVALGVFSLVFLAGCVAAAQQGGKVVIWADVWRAMAVLFPIIGIVYGLFLLLRERTGKKAP